MKLTLPGDPIALQRPRFSRAIGRAYNSQYKIMEEKKQEIRDLLNAIGDHPDLLEIAKAQFYTISLIFYCQIPLSSPDGNLMAWQLKYHTKSDLDNKIKFILDILNGLLFSDDRAIVEIKAAKVFSFNPRTEIEIMPKKTVTLPCHTEDFLKIFSPSDLALLLQDIQLLSEKYDTEQDILSLPDSQKYLWLVEMSKDLISFSEKFADKLHKLKNKNKTSGVGKTLS